MVTATIFTLFQANIQRWRPLAATSKEVARPSPAPALLWLYWLGHHIPRRQGFMFPRRSLQYEPDIYFCFIVLMAKGRHLCILAVNKVNIIAVTTILVLHVGNGRSENV